MTRPKRLPKKSIEALEEKAEECVAIAKAQRKVADQQHEAAHKLENLANNLAQDAAEMKDDHEVMNETLEKFRTKPSASS